MKSLNTAFVGLWGALGRIALAMLLALALPLAAVGAYGETTDPADDTGDTGDTGDDDTGDDTTGDDTTTTSSGGGGGGGGGGGSYRSVRDEEATIPAATEQSCSALLVSDVSPDRDEVAEVFNQISFTVAGDVDLTSIIITVDGTELEAAVELVGTQTYRISAEIIPPLSSAGEHLVFFSVSSATSTNCTDARSYSVFVPEAEVEEEEVQPEAEQPAEQEQVISSYAQLAADTFLDISKNFWAAEAVGKLFEQGVVSGTRTAGGLALFRPADSVNRAEAAKLSATAFGLAIPVRGRTSFSDVPADQWYAPFFSALQGAGVLQGYADGTARPAQVMTRAEALKIAFQSVGIEPASVSGRTFVDLGPQHWAAPYAELAQALEVIGGYPIGEGDRFIAFRPEQAITRAEFAAVVARVQDAVGTAPQG